VSGIAAAIAGGFVGGLVLTFSAGLLAEFLKAR
jgi:hypothetical protein